MRLRVARKVTWFTDTRGRRYRPSTMMRAEKRLSTYESLSRRTSKFVRGIFDRMTAFERFDFCMDMELLDLEETLAPPN